ncbi:MAG: mannose-1-phosphate guanylyltransferase [Bacteroidota bacterium]|nr:mannose-1-phosphate guanylyltransferase [Bacteroidota bacterium]
MGNNYCVIMGGGIGSRFWPFSRTHLPKQFLDFFGTGRSLLQMTYDRFAKILPKENIIIVTNEGYAGLIKEQLPELSDAQILFEPQRRNTAPCIAWASYHIRSKNPNANIVVAPSDHLILNEEEFVNTIQNGLNFVKDKKTLLTLGMTPNRPETGYGYIQIGEEVKGNIKKVKTFTEKPNLELAKVFLQTGEFFWNSGIFLWNVNSIISEFERQLPDVAEIFAAGNNAYNTPEEQEFIDLNFPACPNISIDYGIMEKAEEVAVLCAEFGWSDLGTWGSLYDISPKDADANVTLKCESLTYDSKSNMIVLPKGKLAVVQGLEGYIIVESDNVLLICKKDDEQRIRQFVVDTQMKLGEEYV